MIPYTANDLIRSMNHAYGDSIPTQHLADRAPIHRRFLTWARTFLHLA